MHTQSLPLPAAPLVGRARPPSQPAWLLAMFFCLLAMSFQSGCAGNQRQAVLSKTLVAVDAARIGFIVWDDAHQQELVEAAASYEEGAAALEAYRKRRAPVLLAFELTYQAIARAALEDGDITLASAKAKLQQLLALIRALTLPPSTF